MPRSNIVSKITVFHLDNVLQSDYESMKGGVLVKTSVMHGQREVQKPADKTPRTGIKAGLRINTGVRAGGHGVGANHNQRLLKR